MKLPISALLLTLVLLVSPTMMTVVSAQDAAPIVAPAVSASDLANNPEFKAAFDEAMKKFVAGDFNGALESLNGLYQKQPGISPPRVMMAKLFANSNIPQATQGWLEKATQETPNDPEAFLLLAEIALGQRGLTAAGLLLGKADTLVAAYNANPERKKALSTKALQLRAVLCEAVEDWAGTQKNLTALIGLQGELPGLYRQLGICLFRQKQDDPAREMMVKAQALQTAEEAAKVKSGEKKEAAPVIPADALMSQLYMQRGEVDAARKMLDAALTAAPNSLEVHSHNVLFYLAENNLDAAKVAVEELHRIDWMQARDAKRLGPDNQPDVSDNTKRLVATVALFRGEYLVAETFFEKLVLKSPGDTASVNGLALALCEQIALDAEGKPVLNDKGEPTPIMLKLQRAAEYAQGNVQKNQNNREFLGTLAWVLIKAGNKQQALEIIKRAIADGQMTPDTAFYLAKLSVDDENYEQARNLLTQAIAYKRPFLKRAEADKLLKSLPAAPAAATTGAPAGNQ